MRDQIKYTNIKKDKSGGKGDADSLQTVLNGIDLVTSAALNDLETRKADKTDLDDLSAEYNTFKNQTNEALNGLETRKANKTDLNDLLSEEIRQLKDRQL